MDVVVVGSCMIDLISYVPRLPKPGETLHGDSFSIGHGGKGANQCVQAARLGAKTAMVAKVGVDTFGQGYIQNFKDNNVNIDHVHQTDEAFSGVAPIAVNKDGQNAIIIVSGANHKLTSDDVTKAEPVIGQSKVVVCQLEILPEVTLTALKLAKKNGDDVHCACSAVGPAKYIPNLVCAVDPPLFKSMGAPGNRIAMCGAVGTPANRVTTILNPAPAVESIPDEMLQNCDIFCPNESEAELLTGLPVTNFTEAEVAARRLLSRGPGRVIITLGAEGALTLATGDASATHVKSEKVQPVDTTGAGDSFVGALSYYLSCHPSLNISEAIRRSCQIATISVQKPGTQTSYPKHDDLPTAFFS